VRQDDTTIDRRSSEFRNREGKKWNERNRIDLLASGCRLNVSKLAKMAKV